MSYYQVSSSDRFSNISGGYPPAAFAATPPPLAAGGYAPRRTLCVRRPPPTPTAWGGKVPRLPVGGDPPWARGPPLSPARCGFVGGTGPHSSPAPQAWPGLWPGPGPGPALGPGPSGPTRGHSRPTLPLPFCGPQTGHKTFKVCGPGPAKCGRSFFRTRGSGKPLPLRRGPPVAPGLRPGPPAPAPEPPGQGGRSSARRRGPPRLFAAVALGSSPLWQFGGGFCLRRGFLRRGFLRRGLLPLPSPSGGGARLVLLRP